MLSCSSFFLYCLAFLTYITERDEKGSGEKERVENYAVMGSRVGTVPG